MAAKKKPSAVEFATAELKKNKNASFHDIEKKAAKKGIKVVPLNYGLAKKHLGLGKPKKVAARRGRPRRGESKSDKIRALLKQGLKPAQIAKRVGCSPNLVYVVKSKSGTVKRSVGRPRKAKATVGTGGDLANLVQGLKAIQQERDAYRAELEDIRKRLDAVLS